MAFLGNPGNQYRLTRHNFAWRQLDEINWIPQTGWQKKFKGSYLQVPGKNGRVVILKPETYMNKSGESIGAAAGFFKIKPQEVLVVHDDIELPFGGWALKKGGGLGGHNGLRSMTTALGTKEFYRFRMGVGRPQRGDVASFVLGRFTPHEEEWLKDIVTLGEEILETLLSQEPENLPSRLKAGQFNT